MTTYRLGATNGRSPVSRDHKCIFCKDEKTVTCLACENLGDVSCYRCNGTRKIECSMCRTEPKHQHTFKLTYKQVGHPPHEYISEIYAMCKCGAEMREKTIHEVINSGYVVDEDLWQRIEKYMNITKKDGDVAPADI